MAESFVAVDVETANADQGSICSIGIAHFQDSVIIDSWYSLVDPEDYFDGFNVAIHGISERTVRGAPTFPEIHHEIARRFGGLVVVSHMPFDRIALTKACAKYHLQPAACTWLDSARVSRRAWAQFAYAGYGLKAVAKHLGIEFQHHHALEDAKVAGRIVCEAIRHAGVSLEDWLYRVSQPIDPTAARPITRQGNPDGPLFGETIVFTGALSIPRSRAAEIAAQAGCQVAPGVTKETTLLCVGQQDSQKLNGRSLSSKHRKAIEYAKSGQDIRILSESDFFAMIGTSGR